MRTRGNVMIGRKKYSMNANVFPSIGKQDFYKTIKSVKGDNFLGSINRGMGNKIAQSPTSSLMSSFADQGSRSKGRISGGAIIIGWIDFEAEK